MGDVEDRLPDLRERRSFLLHDLEDMSRGARFFRNDDNITDKMWRRGQRMLLQIDAALASMDAKSGAS